MARHRSEPASLSKRGSTQYFLKIVFNMLILTCVNPLMFFQIICSLEALITVTAFQFGLFLFPICKERIIKIECRHLIEVSQRGRKWFML